MCRESTSKSPRCAERAQASDLHVQREHKQVTYMQLA